MNMRQLSLRSATSAQRWASPFLTVNFTIQSYLPLGEKPFYRTRQSRLLLGYAALVVVATAARGWFTTPSDMSAALLGLTFPGAGFLHWATGDQVLHASGLFGAAIALFMVALLLWFATGNVLAPAISWAGLAWLAAHPDLFQLEVRHGWAAVWPWLIGPLVVSLATAGWCRGVLAASGAPTPQFASCHLSAGVAHSTTTELSHDNSKRLRLLLDRALQPVEKFNGFERRDQFQTAALRYQVNFMSYALAFAQVRHAPAASAYFADAQDRLLTKIGDRRLWTYWGLENAWGNLRIGRDPVARQNIMYSGFTTLQMALGGGETLVLHASQSPVHSHGLGELAELLASQYRSSRYGLLDCEPNWIYPLCNLITMVGIKAADSRLGSNRWESLAEPFLDALVREGLRDDGTFIAFRSSLTGIAPPAPGGIVMQAFPCLFLNALSPEMAGHQWRLVRQRLDHGSWKRLFWPVDVGNYAFSRASSYAATAAAAVEMGDEEVASECLRRLDEECPSHELAGAIHRENASLWAHALELIARCSEQDGLRNLTASKIERTGPHLAAAPYPEVIVAHAAQRDRRLNLILDPGRANASPLLELGGLMPERHYHTGLAAAPFVRSDHQGRALLRIDLNDRTRITLDPVV